MCAAIRAWFTTDRWCARSSTSRFPTARPSTWTTDATWKAKASPITPLGKGTAFGDYGGEHYDARLEVSGWNSVKLDDSAWEAAAVFDPPKVTTAAQMVEPNRILETLKPVKIEATPAGGWLIDMGKNYTGWLDLRLPGGHRGRQEPEDRVRRQSARRRPVCTFNQRDEYVTRAGAGQVSVRASTITPSATLMSPASAQAPVAADVQRLSSCAPATAAPASSNPPMSC